MDSLKLWLKQAWLWLAGAGALVFILWLRFFHDPQVAKEAELETRRKQLRKKLDAFEKSEKDTSEQEDRLKENIEATDAELERVRSERVSDDVAADDIRGWLKRRRSDEDNPG